MKHHYNKMRFSHDVPLQNIVIYKIAKCIFIPNLNNSSDVLQ